MANFPFPNGTNINSIVNLLGFVNNELTEGWFGFAMLITIFFISVLSLKQFEMNKAFTAACFFTATMALLFRAMGILADKFLWLPFVFVALGLLWLQFDR